MWWVPTGKLMQIFAAHAAPVSCGCWAQGGKLIVTGSEDRSVIVWNPRGGTPQHHIKEVHEQSVTCICTHQEQPLIVTGSEDSTVKVMHLETGKVLTALSVHTD